MDIRVGPQRRLSAEELMLLNCGVGEDSWESLGLQGDQTSPFWRRSILNIHWRDWCWGWSSKPLATWCKESIHWKRPYIWERLRQETGMTRGQDGWMASLTEWTWVWANSRRWWRTGKPSAVVHGVAKSQTWKQQTPSKYIFWLANSIRIKSIYALIYC